MLSNYIDRIKLLFRSDRELYLSLYPILGFYPNHIEHYKLALLHKSASQRNNKGQRLNNERLEFLGDAILGAIIGDIVYERFPNKREGFLTNTRSKIVQRGTLNKLSREMGITQLLNQRECTHTHNSYLAGNAFEALMGAIYLDKGYDTCMRFIKKRILGELINIDKVANEEINFKSKLIEWGQKHHVDVEFNMLKESQDENKSPVFRFQAILGGVPGEDGQGYSKKESQQVAAQKTLNRLKSDKDFSNAILSAKKKQQPNQGNRETTEDDVELIDLTAAPEDRHTVDLSSHRSQDYEHIVSAAESAAYTE